MSRYVNRHEAIADILGRTNAAIVELATIPGKLAAMTKDGTDREQCLLQGKALVADQMAMLAQKANEAAAAIRKLPARRRASEDRDTKRRKEGR